MDCSIKDSIGGEDEVLRPNMRKLPKPVVSQGFHKSARRLNAFLECRREEPCYVLSNQRASKFCLCFTCSLSLTSSPSADMYEPLSWGCATLATT